jgi:hypothetical protein
MSKTWPLLVLMALKYCAEKRLLKTHVVELILPILIFNNYYQFQADRDFDSFFNTKILKKIFLHMTDDFFRFAETYPSRTILTFLHF